MDLGFRPPQMQDLELNQHFPATVQSAPMMPEAHSAACSQISQTRQRHG